MSGEAPVKSVLGATHSRAERTNRIIQTIIVTTLIPLLLLSLGRLWYVEGFIRTVRIDGPSMAPTLLGTHYRVTCGDCGISFVCDADHVPHDMQAVCPNCGFRENPLRETDLQPGDMVLVDRWPLLWSAPRKGEVVMLRVPALLIEPQESSYAVKRIAGLPEERIAIRGGDLYVNDRQERKTLAQLRQVAVLVHDNDHLPSGGFARWKPATSTTGWAATKQSIRYQAPGSQGEATPDWLVYEHWRCDGSSLPRTAPAEILDNDSYNQGENRRLNTVHDLLLDCQMLLTENCRLSLVLRARGETITARLDSKAGTIQILQGEKQLGSAKLPSARDSRAIHIEFAICDGQVLLGVDERSLFQVALEPNSSDPSVASKTNLPRCEMGAEGGSVEVTHLRVLRDLYLLEPNGTGRDWEPLLPLPAECFLAFGDNQPVSIDGRHWEPADLPRDHILGRICRVLPRAAP